MLYTILILLALAVAVILILASKKPDDFRYSRSLAMAARPSIIFPHVNNLFNWNTWSPWAKLDLNAKTTFSGPDAGVGAAMKWDGNNKVGAGTLTITESVQDQRIVMRLDFERPFKGTQMCEFTFEPQGDMTLVTWAAFGESPFIGKVMSVIMDCEKMTCNYYDKGLANLKSVVER